MKKLFSVLSIVLIMLLTVFTTSAQTEIVDSMEFTGQQTSLTLDAAISKAMEGNPDMEQSKLDLAQAAVNYDSDNMSYLKMRKIPGADKEGTLNYYQAEVFKLTMEFNKANAQRNYDATAAGLKADIQEAYYGLLQAKELVNINKNNLDVFNDLFSKTQKKFDLGLVSKQDVLNAELNSINAQNTYNSSVNTYKVALMSLNSKLGNNVMANTVLNDQLTAISFENVSIAKAVTDALANRKEIKAAEYAYEAEKINLEITRMQHSDISNDYKIEQIKADKAAKSLESAKNGIEIEVRNNYMTILQKQDEITSGQKAVELASQALKSSQVSYDNGLATQSDVQNAQVALQQAQLGLSKSILDFNIAVIKFQNSTQVGVNPVN